MELALVRQPSIVEGFSFKPITSQLGGSCPHKTRPATLRPAVTRWSRLSFSSLKVIFGRLHPSITPAKEASMSPNFNPLDHPDAEVSRAYFCQLTGRARITAYRHERLDPNWPKPIVRGKRVFYKAADCKRYLESVHPSDRPRRP